MQKYNDSIHRRERKIRKLIIPESKKTYKNTITQHTEKKEKYDDWRYRNQKKTLENTTIQHTEKKEKYED